MITFEGLLIDKKEVAPNIYFLTFENGKSYHFEFKAGQYVIATIPTGVQSVKRLYTIASSPLDKTSFNLLIKRVEDGVGSVFLSDLAPGSTVHFSGPAGLFFLQESTRHKIFLATGTGLAPVLSFLSTYQNIRFSLFWGLQTMKDVYFLDYFKKHADKNALFDYHICLSKEAPPVVPSQSSAVFFPGRVDKAMEFYMGSIFEDVGRNSFEYYICGSRTVVESLKTQLLTLGVEKERIFFEKY